MDELIQTSPIAVEKSVRGDEIRSLTSTMGGVIVPLCYIPVLREESITRGDLRIAFDMAETIHPLLNSVNVTAHAYFVSNLAFERFDGMDSLNRSYQGIPEPYNATVIPFIKTMAFANGAGVWRKLGVHWPEGAAINQAPVEAYNLIVNHRRRARTDRLPERTALDTTLAECFWKNVDLAHVVPDWDQAAMEGEVELTVVANALPVRGIGTAGGTAVATGTPTVRQTGGLNTTGKQGWYSKHPTPTAGTEATTVLLQDPLNPGFPNIYAEMVENGITVSLANIELAKKTASFAKLRERFDGIDDDHIIDLLMEGIRVPDQAQKQPLLLDRKSTIFGYTERHAMDGDNLEKSVTTGRTALSLRLRLPPMNAGGIVLVTCEIVPEQLYERKFDSYLGTLDPALLPNFMRDYLDPEKVEVVQNKYPDVLHSTPVSTFGYAPLNHSWKRSFTRAGGKFYRPNPDTFVEDRQRFWAVDQINPTLSDDFYMVSDLPHSVFADTVSDAFEVLTLGRVGIVGNTVFGDGLEEDSGSYEAIMDQVDTGRIDQVPVALAAKGDSDA